MIWQRCKRVNDCTRENGNFYVTENGVDQALAVIIFSQPPSLICHLVLRSVNNRQKGTENVTFAMTNLIFIIKRKKFKLKLKWLSKSRSHGNIKWHEIKKKEWHQLLQRAKCGKTLNVWRCCICFNISNAINIQSQRGTLCLPSPTPPPSPKVE